MNADSRREESSPRPGCGGSAMGGLLDRRRGINGSPSLTVEHCAREEDAARFNGVPPEQKVLQLQHRCHHHEDYTSSGMQR